MAWRHSAGALLVSLGVLGGCATSEPSRASASASSATTMEPGDAPATLSSGEVGLSAGTYRLDLTALAPGADPYPAFVVTVPDGWTSMDGWALARFVGAQETPVAGVTFWDVAEVYRHPCAWTDTETDPGPGVDDLVAALIDVPMRNATRPVAVEVDGAAGQYLEWSVPSDIAFDEGGDFPDCDPDSGHRDFKSWTGSGWASNRYHQGPGQLDRLWVLDVDGERLVIDAFSMPSASDADVQELVDIVQSIRFDR